MTCGTGGWLEWPAWLMEDRRYYFFSTFGSLLNCFVLITFHRSCFFFLGSHLLCNLILEVWGARVAPLSLWPCLPSLEYGEPEHLEALGGDLDKHIMNFLNAADCALASLNFTTIVLTDVPKVQRIRLGHQEENFFLSDVHQVQPQIPLCFHHSCPPSSNW